MKKILFGIFCLATASAMGQVTKNIQWTKESSLPVAQTIYYDTAARLKWDDFKGVPQDMGIVAAVTYSGFGYKADISSSGDKSRLNIKVYCYFNKNKSWVKEGKKTAYILAHEQHHFDISYIAACIFMDRLQGAVFSKTDLNVQLPRIYQECVDMMDRMQDEYDSQTKNGQVKEEQEKWNRKLTSMINQFSEPVKI